MFRMIQKFKLKSTPSDELITFKDFHNIRYTFVKSLFQYYKQLDDRGEFELHLQGLKSWYIWNIYKQLSFDVLDKINQSQLQSAAGGTGNASGASGGNASGAAQASE